MFFMIPFGSYNLLELIHYRFRTNLPWIGNERIPKGYAQLPCIVAVGVNNSFLRILLHKWTFLVSTIVTDTKKIYPWRFWRFLGDFWAILLKNEFFHNFSKSEQFLIKKNSFLCKIILIMAHKIVQIVSIA